MRTQLTALAGMVVLVVAPTPVRAKGDTVRISIEGGDLARAVHITDAAVAAFHVWAGPGTSSGEQQSLIVDWSRGAVKRPPQGLPTYAVSFETTRRNPGTYLVLYVIDTSTDEGYVYVPGRSDPGYRDNVGLIYRGVEGNWFHAWREWEKVAHPMIVKARNR